MQATLGSLSYLNLNSESSCRARFYDAL